MAPGEKHSPRQTERRKQRIAKSRRLCHCCRQTFMFCWHCRCGFSMCQACMHENAWGLTCNGITWTCPDCGGQNGYGNQ